MYVCTVCSEERVPGNKHFSKRGGADIKWNGPFPPQLITYFEMIFSF